MKELMIVIVVVVVAVCSYLCGVHKTKKEIKKEILERQRSSDKHLKLFRFATEWVKLLQNKKTLAAFFEENAFKKVAVYGASYLGQCLINELEQNDVEVVYVIDKKVKSCFVGKPVKEPHQITEDVDAFIVTAITFFDEIEEELLKHTDVPIISLEEIMNEMKK